jgi:dihydroorotate dehydrogenase electron transfer subunit
VPAAQFQVRVVRNETLSGGYFRLWLRADDPSPVADARPGQFVMLRGDWGRDLINGRAFSVLDAPDAERFTVLAKVFGRGTARLAAAAAGEPLTCTGPLGHGFPAPGKERRQLLVAGGVGLPPLHLQARVAAAAGLADRVEVLYGGRNADDLVLVDEIEREGVSVALASEDGSLGTRGRVTVLLEDRLARPGEDVEVLACGPTPMLAAVRKLGLGARAPTYLCLEEQMACGFGVCLGCAVPVFGPKPYRYCCTDGPVFEAAEVRWP